MYQILMEDYNMNEINCLLIVLMPAVGISKSNNPQVPDTAGLSINEGFFPVF